MTELDLIIRNADIATAADRYRADIGVRGETASTSSPPACPRARCVLVDASSMPRAAWSRRAAWTATATSTSP